MIYKFAKVVFFIAFALTSIIAWAGLVAVVAAAVAALALILNV